jgi:transposase-like protein
LPVQEEAFRRSKRKVGRSWRMDEIYVKVNGEWKYLYRAVDKAGDTVDFLLGGIATRPLHTDLSNRQSSKTGSQTK